MQFSALLQQKTGGGNQRGDTLGERSPSMIFSGSGFDVMLTIFLRFGPIFGEKMASFSKPDVMIKLLQKLAVYN
jgi:hypothetical protein